MAFFTFDGPALRIYCHADDVVGGVIHFSVWDMYREWKEWVLSGEGAKFPPAFRVVGGDPIGGGQYVGTYLFLRNDLGWRGVPPNVSPVVVDIEGSLFGEDEATPIIEYLLGNTVTIQIRNSALVNTVATSGSTGPSASDVADEVMARLLAATIPTDVKKINAVTLKGSGVAGDEWGPA